MVGYIDVGGGMRAVYGAGVLDRCLDEKIEFNYYLGVSAGSANIISFLADQRGRCLRFYRDYSFRREYMSMDNFVKKGSYIDLDYIYTTLTSQNGEDPLDFERLMTKKCEFYIVTTNAETGESEYFSFSDVKRDDYFELKASCCIPMVCKACEKNGRAYYDGGLADPIPIRRALEAGCDKVVVTLTRPVEYTKYNVFPLKLCGMALKQYPESARLIHYSAQKYNDDLKYIRELEKEGRVLIIAPDNCCNVSTLTRNKSNLEALYNKGFHDAEKIKSFING